MAKRYILMVGGEFADVFLGKDYVLKETKWAVDQYISDFLRDALPIKITKGEAALFDIQVYEIGEDQIVDLPLQQWCDQYYQEMEDSAKEEEEVKYQRYLTAREEFEPVRLKRGD